MDFRGIWLRPRSPLRRGFNSIFYMSIWVCLKMGYTPSYVNFKSSSWWNTPPETFFFCLGVRTHIWDHTMGVCNMNGQNGINNHVLVLPSSFYRHLFVHLVVIVGPFIEAFSCWLVDTPWSVHTLRSSISWNPVGTVNFVAAEVGICQRPCRRFWMNGRAGWSNVWKGCIVASRPLSLGLFAFFGDNLLPSLTRS